MTEKSFLEEIKSIENILFWRNEERNKLRDGYENIYGKELDTLSLDDYLYVDWTSGGSTGRGCWGEENSYPVPSDKEPYLDDIDKIIEYYCPDISLMKYKKLLKSIPVKEGTFSDGGDYYGNYYEKSYKAILLRDIYNTLNDGEN